MTHAGLLLYYRFSYHHHITLTLPSLSQPERRSEKSLETQEEEQSQQGQRNLLDIYFRLRLACHAIDF